MHPRSIRGVAIGVIALSSMVAVPAACSSEPTAGSPTSTPSPSADASLAPHTAATYEYVVPAGTGVRLDDGEAIELMPQTLFVKVGESIYIENQDDRDYTVGPFFVAAGQSLAMRFNTVTVLSGQCLMNPSGEFQIIVAE